MKTLIAFAMVLGLIALVTKMGMALVGNKQATILIALAALIASVIFGTSFGDLLR